MPIWTFILALLFSSFLTPGIRELSRRWGLVVEPKADRWHRRSTPTLGGVAMYLAFLAAVLLTGEEVPKKVGLLIGFTLMFLIGVYDDVKRLSPPAKLLGQIACVAVVVFFGFNIVGFFPWQLLNVLLTFVWIVAITNAINLLDNMDGLAAGLAFVAAGFLSFFFWQGGQVGLLTLAIALAGSSLGFLIFNFPPASIFMGDSGSLFLGFSLSALAVARVPQASNVFGVMGVPILLFLLPIVDTTFVTITRLLRGQSPVKGGRDHASHRLVAFGLTDRQAVIFLLSVAVVSGVASAVLESLDYSSSLVLIPLLVIGLSLLVAYLGRIKVFSETVSSHPGNIMRIVVDLTYRHRLLEIILDFFLVSLAYYLAFWTQHGFRVDREVLDVYLRSTPLALVGSYLSFAILGVYRGVWRYVGVRELVRYIQAAFLGAVLTALPFLWVYPGQFTLVIFFLFAVFLFLGLSVSRGSFRLLDQLYSGQPHAGITSNIVICNAGDSGEIVLRWLELNPTLGYNVLGFLDEDHYLHGRRIHGVEVLGGLEWLVRLSENQSLEGIIVTPEANQQPALMEKLMAICQAKGLWVRVMRLEFEALE
ncbi:MAG: hypothetical protein AB1345_04220 [Chloroflexota bacterium]